MTALCSDCPDHEACMTGYPCEVVRRHATTPPPKPPAWAGDTIDWPEWECPMCGLRGYARPHTPILCTCRHVTWSGPPYPKVLVWEGDYA